jgi:dihydropteroate synthase
MSNKLTHLLNLQRPLVMGILNTTPDSFSDGGRFNITSDALHHARLMIAEGADIIDVGGESTRPGAQPVAVEDELQRVIPVIEAIAKQSSVAISIDTSKVEVMRAAVRAGADMVNDVNALAAEGALSVCAQLDVPVCLMHRQGSPQAMQNSPQYKNVVEDIRLFFKRRVNACVQAGIKRQNILLDPGFGFGKTLAHNLSLLKRLDEFLSLDLPILVGVSRKSMLGAILDAAVDERLSAGLAAAVMAHTKGARIFRVHDVKPTVDALKISQAVLDAD